MNGTTTAVTIDDRREALRWIIVNRREEVSFEQAIKTLRFALRDRQAQTLLDDIAAEQAH
ncbi:hypothetical protein [Ralstonia solanacearum]|uniref:hypothetical protein n=1 Tax=Ralstonia solanacearum TaxID=305 RepID=UPI000F612203|nr:hypothetical protein [Ralstonia solanacearum]